MPTVCTFNCLSPLTNSRLHHLTPLPRAPLGAPWGRCCVGHSKSSLCTSGVVIPKDLRKGHICRLREPGRGLQQLEEMAVAVASEAMVNSTLAVWLPDLTDFS